MGERGGEHHRMREDRTSGEGERKKGGKKSPQMKYTLLSFPLEGGKMKKKTRVDLVYG